MEQSAGRTRLLLQILLVGVLLLFAGRVGWCSSSSSSSLSSSCCWCSSSPSSSAAEDGANGARLLSTCSREEKTSKQLHSLSPTQRAAAAKRNAKPAALVKASRALL